MTVNTNTTRRTRARRGFTLIETLLAMCITAMVGGGIATMMSVLSRTSASVEARGVLIRTSSSNEVLSLRRTITLHGRCGWPCPLARGCGKRHVHASEIRWIRQIQGWTIVVDFVAFPDSGRKRPWPLPTRSMHRAPMERCTSDIRWSRLRPRLHSSTKCPVSRSARPPATAGLQTDRGRHRVEDHAYGRHPPRRNHPNPEATHPMTPPLRHPVRPRHVRRHRRGIALLLVLIAMATATTLTLGWLASQDNASIVGRNIATAAEARALACSGIDLAASITQTESAWRDVGADGILMQHYPIGEGTIDLSVLDQATNMPPTAATTDLLVTATGRIGPLAQVVTASINLLEDEDGWSMVKWTISPSLPGAIELSNHASVLRWADAPASSLGRRIAIGTAERRPRRSTARKSNVIDGTLYQHGSASPVSSTEHNLMYPSCRPVVAHIGWSGRHAPIQRRTDLGASSRTFGFEWRRCGHSTGPDRAMERRRRPQHRWRSDHRIRRVLISGPAELQVGGNLIMDDSMLLEATRHWKSSCMVRSISTMHGLDTRMADGPTRIASSSGVKMTPRRRYRVLMATPA